MKHRLAILVLLPAAVLLASCSQLEETATGIATDAASQVAEAAADEVRGQACLLVEDGLVSVKDQQVLTGLVTSAETAGVPADFLDPLREVAQAGDEVPQESVESLQDRCAQPEG
ncbi:hypothetical protein [Arthrobacter sp. CAN_A1]|uniref:hypothetical protein n=1 Tax=Arthrobacter sp. CAN_A1 TaxID=2787717 RepID=UPI0018CB9F0F